jgi:hypothetical protein
MGEKEQLLKDFLEEFFDFDGLREVGFYDESIKRNDYQRQADRICRFFGYETVYEYGAKELRCHISFGDPDCPSGMSTGKRPKGYEDFVTVIGGIYD